MQLGIDDPEQWLEDCPRRVWQGWKAQYRVAPFGDEQVLLGKILAALYLLVSREGGELSDIDKAVNEILPAFMPGGFSDQKDDGDAGKNSIENFEKIAQIWQPPSTPIA